MNGADAVAKIKAGASLVQLYTGFVYRGPDLIRAVSYTHLDVYKRQGHPCIHDSFCHFRYSFSDSGQRLLCCSRIRRSERTPQQMCIRDRYSSPRRFYSEGKHS